MLSSLVCAAAAFAADRQVIRGPETWLELLGGNVREDGLRCDLEAIKEAGISGVQFFHIGGTAADGVDRTGGVWAGCEEQIPCMSAKWWNMVKTLGEECDRLGLGLTVQNCPGWSQSGGPWIDLDRCQRDLQMSCVLLEGGETFRLPSVPERYRDADSDWRDVAVLAFPTPEGDAADVLSPAAAETNGDTRVYRFAESVTVRSLDLQPCDNWNSAYAYNRPWVHVKLEVETSAGWREVVRTDVPTSNWRDYVLPFTVACGEATGSVWRFSVSHDYPITCLADPVFRSAARTTDWEGKSARTLRSLLRESPPSQSSACWIDRAKIVDLTGRVDWTAPSGRWTVVRFGSVNCKYVNAPAPKEATGWECDKLDPAGIEACFRGYVGRLNEGVLKGKMRAMLVDSWECFCQTWTPKMERYFREANGYELRPWLPALFGWIVGSPEKTEGFLTDWRRTNGNLITKNYYGRMGELAHAADLELYFETAFGDIVHGDLLEYWKYADAPMCEFWYPHRPATAGGCGSYPFKPIRPCASAAHIYGKRRVVAEAFTGSGIQWNEDFRRLQDDANRHFARGVTHLAFQSYTHAPLPDSVPPGGCMGGYNGTPFTRLQTWWKLMPEFTGWLTRCEEFLEAGQPAQDVLWYLGDAVDHKPDELYPFPEGFRADYLNHDVLTNRLCVKDGLFTIPEGATWRVLWVPDELFMLPATRAALDRLAAAGGTVAYGGKDALVKALSGIRKDVATEPALGDEPSEDFMWIHRKVDGLDRYFVAAGTNGYRGKVTFRAKGPVSVFDPVSCERRAWTNGDTLEIPPSRSVFVEFGRGAERVEKVESVEQIEVRDWTLEFKKGWGAPEKVSLETPVSWTEIPGFSREARAYPGTVVYAATFDLQTLNSQLLTLNLSRVESIAKVFVNGREVRTLWCEPYRCDISRYVVKGRNELRIEVTNTWRNRVIYDLGLSEKDRKTWILYKEGFNPRPTDAFGPAGILGPVVLTASRFEPSSTPFGAAPYDVRLDGKVLDCHPARISAVPFNRVWTGVQRSMEQTREGRFVQFDLPAAGELTVKFPAAAPAATVYPLSDAASARRDGGAWRLKLAKPGYHVFDFGEEIPPLHVFANAPAAVERRPGDIYFGPGEHEVGIIAPTNGQTVVIDAGAVVRGEIFIDRATNVTVTGRGILDASGFSRADPRAKAFRRSRGLPEEDTEFACHSCVVYASRNVVISGIVIRDTPFWALIVRNGSKDVLIDGVKVIGQWRYNSDGIDIAASEDVTVRNCFMRTFDDCAVVLDGYLDPDANWARNVRFENCFLWCDWDDNIKVWAGAKQGGIEGVCFTNCVLAHVDARGCSVNGQYSSPSTVVRDIVFEDLEYDVALPRPLGKIQRHDGDRYSFGDTNESLELLAVDVRPPSANLGNQHFRLLTETEQEHCSKRFSDIVLRRARVLGNAQPLTVSVRAKGKNQSVRNVRFEDMPDFKLTTEGDVALTPGAEFVSPLSGRGGCGCAHFERCFTNAQEITRARWRLTGQGVFEAFVNGRRVGNDFLKPGFTENGKCRHVYSYDVTDILDCRKGAGNVLSATVSPGWWCDEIMRSARITPWQTGDEVAFWGELALEFADGTSAMIATDENWLGSYSGPVVSAGIYEGEYYDASRRPCKLWPVRINREFKGELRPATAKIALRKDLEMKPVSAYVARGTVGAKDGEFGQARIVARYVDGEKIVLEPGDRLVVDFGQNCSAVPSFRASGVSWAKITVRHSEMLNESNGEASRGNDGPAGIPYLASLRRARAAFEVTPGEGEHLFQPRHTFFGYRYLLVTADEKVALRDFRSTPVTSVTREMERGHVVIGNARVNRLIENIRWSTLSNYLSIPTDCPQRDERMGWTADTQVFMNSAAYLFDTYDFLSKYLADLRDAQFADGLYPCFAPNLRHVFPHWASAGWTDAGVLIPYRLWKWYGKAEIVKTSWPSMKKYMDFLESHETPYQINHGDWLAFEHTVKNADGTDKEAPDPRQVHLLNDAFRVWMARLMRKMAEATGRSDEARHFAGEEARHRAIFAERYVGGDGCLKDEYKGQCNDLYMLKLGLCGNAAAVEATKKDLIANIRAHGNRLQTGFLGTAILMPTLTFEADAPDVAYDLLLQDKFPSWLYSVDQGATTVWERWNGYTKEKGFGPVIMNSFNHYAYGCVLEWLFSAAAGIRPDPKGGWRHFVLKPYPDRRLGSCEASYRSDHGTIRSAWKYEDDKLVWKFTVPSGTSAEVTEPDGRRREFSPGDYERIY